MPSLLQIKKNIENDNNEDEPWYAEPAPKRKYKELVATSLIIFFIFLCRNPEYITRHIYPHIYGKKTDIQLDYMTPEFYEDIKKTKPFKFVRNDIEYELIAKTKYSVTGRVGYVDEYDTFFNRLYRGHSQGRYINLVPQDLVIVTNEMAKPEVYNLFKFIHEERSGGVKCKGVKYKESWFSLGYSNLDEYRKALEKLAVCDKYYNPITNNEYLNNYHPIPSNKNIEKALAMIFPYDIVYLEGILVDETTIGLNTGTRKNQFHEYVVSGRNPGMCFILYVTKVILNGYVYE